MKKIIALLLVCLMSVAFLNACTLTSVEEANGTNTSDVDVSKLLNDNKEFLELCEEIFGKDAKDITAEDFARVQYLYVCPDYQSDDYIISVVLDTFNEEYKIYSEQLDKWEEDVDENMKWGSIVEVTDTTVNPYKNEKQFRYSGKKFDSKVLGLLSGVGYLYLNSVEIDDGKVFGSMKNLFSAEFENCKLADVSGFASLDLDKIERIDLFRTECPDYSPLMPIADRVYLYVEQPDGQSITIETLSGEKEEDEVKEDYTYLLEEGKIEEYINKMGFEFAPDGYWRDYVASFCNYAINKEYASVAGVLGGFANDFSFVENMDISGFSLYSVKLTEDKKQLLSDSVDEYVLDSEYYLAVFNVEKEPEYNPHGIKTGKNALILMPYDEAAATLKIVCFPQYFDQFLVDNVGIEEYDSKIAAATSLVGEFADSLSYGINELSEIDFSNRVHYVTHLMAGDSNYAHTPPYSAEEINRFIYDNFDGNAGVDFSDNDTFNMWLYPLYNGVDNARMFGCSYAHGGTAYEIKVDEKKVIGDVTYYRIITYADRAHLLHAKEMVVGVNQNEENNFANIVHVEVLYDYGRRTSSVSY